MAKQGNARIFCPGIIRYDVQQYDIFTFSIELVKRCKLAVNAQFSVSQLCECNKSVCKQLGLTRLATKFGYLSSLLQTANRKNTLMPSVGRSHYISKFVKKLVDELYFKNEIQGIAVIACLLRQSQLFMLLFCVHTNCGYLLTRTVAQYLRVIKYRMDDEDISDLHQLEDFSYLLNEQKKRLILK